MTIIETDSDGLRNTVQLISSCDLLHPDQTTTPRDGVLDRVSDFPLDLNSLIYIRFRRDTKCFPHVPELPPEDFPYRILPRISVQVHHL